MATYNGQGDVVALVNPATQEAVVRYAYDAWGKQIQCTGTMASTLGKENPFRYRGYMVDEETGLYYLRSRYYNPEMGRFLNADLDLGRVGKVLTHNCFSYCLNNAVCLCDPDGRFGEAHCVDGGGSSKKTVTGSGASQSTKSGQGVSKDSITVETHFRNPNSKTSIQVTTVTNNKTGSSVTTETTTFINKYVAVAPPNTQQKVIRRSTPMPYEDAVRQDGYDNRYDKVRNGHEFEDYGKIVHHSRSGTDWLTVYEVVSEINFGDYHQELYVNMDFLEADGYTVTETSYVF